MHMNNSPRMSGYAPVYNGELYYEVQGAGKTILLIHAGVADCSMWEAQFSVFSKSYRVIRYDARGYGKSRSESTQFSNRQDIIDLFDHLGVDQACVIGISRGGQIAIDFTLEHPERVSALVVVAGGISGYDYQPAESGQASQEYELFSHADELWEKKAWDELAELEAHVWADGPSQPVGRAPVQVRDYVRRIVRRNYERQDGQTTPIQLSPLAVNRLSEIKAPTLVMVGEYDTLGTQASMEKLAQDVSHAHKVLIGGTAHMIPMEKPEEFNCIVLEFLKKA